MWKNNNNPKCCRNTKTISLATQVFKSLNGIPHFQTAPADPTVHLICLHVLPLSFSSSLSLSLLFSHWAGISWTSVLGKHSSSTRTAPAPWRTRRDVGMEVGGNGREGRKDWGRTENKRVKRIEEEGKKHTTHRTTQQWKQWKTAIWKWWGRFWVSL